ncbi:hypothetical protein V496_08261 [Pseudogymnoascus sp. VKM F-4515 (FW-2607)]|nr:hypothetical protein V496_08261 [Pseudogymnoascus sp. VKM F-4515 (FW-2607)]KFY87831.1 hypothetical protein V498_06994 [Pseudogymnoascus sp. VKM F-4517 (FW-2822)]
MPQSQLPPELIDPTFGRNDYQAEPQSQLPQELRPYIWKERLPSRTSIAASPDVSKPKFGKNDYQPACSRSFRYIQKLEDPP